MITVHRICKACGLRFSTELDLRDEPVPDFCPRCEKDIDG